MQAHHAIELGQQMLIVSMLVAGPALLAGILVGLLIGLFQALTQIQDQTVAFVPKLVAMVVVLGLMLPWAVQHMMDYSTDLIKNIPRVVRGLD